MNDHGAEASSHSRSKYAEPPRRFPLFLYTESSFVAESARLRDRIQRHGAFEPLARRRAQLERGLGGNEESACYVVCAEFAAADQYANALLKHKVPFGSDHPHDHCRRCLADLEHVAFRDEVKPLMLKENSAKLLTLNKIKD